MSTKFKGTKGNWFAKKNSSFWDVRLENQYQDIEETAISISVMLYKGSPILAKHFSLENAANAQLIASAPRLLDMLEDCVNFLSEIEVPEHLKETYGNLIMNAGATIDDATNPQP